MDKIANKMNTLRKINARRLAPMLLVFISVVLGAACSDSGIELDQELSPEDKNVLVQRSTERWRALEVKDFGKAYEFETPNYRGIFSKSLFVNKFSYAVDWELTDVEVVNYDARAAVASVAVRVMSKPTKQTSEASIALGALPMNLTEKWFFVDGEWWHIAKD
jgi:hypothetical protein